MRSVAPPLTEKIALLGERCHENKRPLLHSLAEPLPKLADNHCLNVGSSVDSTYKVRDELLQMLQLHGIV